MAKAFSVASWNVEHFGATRGNSRQPTKPVEPIIDYLAAQEADVVAVLEVVGAVVWEAVFERMPEYHWHLTEGPQAQEILVGVSKSLSSFCTQRVEFKGGQSTLRPGSLLTILVDGVPYTLLFLHLKSSTDPKGFGLRDDQADRALDLKRTLDQRVANPNFLFLGDLNTMGMNLTYSAKDVSAEEEIARLQSRVRRKRMTVLEKGQRTWWPGSGSSYPVGDLDHVVAAEHLSFRSFGGFPVDVRGWPELGTDAARDAWTATHSDHALLYFEVQRV